MSNSFAKSFVYTSLLIIILWIVKFVEVLFGVSFAEYGILPHEYIGLRGIVFSPFIHGDFMHLLSNTVPCFVLMMVLFNTYEKVAFPVIVTIHLSSGLLVWLLAPAGGAHIGISAIIYGIAGFLVGSGIFRRDRQSTAIAIVVAMLYGGMITGFVPQTGISWQGHLAGALVGLVCAYALRHVNRVEDQLPMEEERHFFDQN